MNDAYLAAILPDKLPSDPMHWAGAWLEHATSENLQRNPNAMTVATVAADGQPSSRVVLCKHFVAAPGYIVFFTNYLSQKVNELRRNPGVAANFHWDAFGRQVRLQGQAVFSPAGESDAYFASRDWGSQLGAWGSDQSARLASRAALKQQVRQRARELGVDVSADLQSLGDGARPDIPRPPHWGGIRIWPQRIELWIEGADRIHDRAAWTRSLSPLGPSDFAPGQWSGTRLQP